ncbi:MAG: glycosyl hydrolase, partial [bacterium]
MLKSDHSLDAPTLAPAIRRLFEASSAKILRLEKRWDAVAGTPVFTEAGAYTSRGWTEWTQGFQFGAALLQFDATGDAQFLEIGRTATRLRMASHVTHVGVHDHGFNNVSTYGNLWRLARERRFAVDEWELRFYELALKVSGAVQAGRWTRLPDGGFIHSFNGPHSLFVDTVRTLRSLALSHLLGQRLFE